MHWAAIKGPLIASIIISTALLVGGLLLLGLPGALYALPAAPVVELVLGRPFGSLLADDTAWGKAILLTLVVPPVIPPLIWFGLWRLNANIWWALLITLVGIWLWSIGWLLYVSLQ